MAYAFGNDIRFRYRKINKRHWRDHKFTSSNRKTSVKNKSRISSIDDIFFIFLSDLWLPWRVSALASSAANSVKCATHMVNLGAEAHQFVLLSNRNSVGGSFHDELLIDRFFFHFCCISEFYWSSSISCFYGLQWILYCVWYLFMDYFVIFIPKMVWWLRWKQQNIIKPQHCEWCLNFKLNWKARAFEQLFWWWQKKLCGTPFWRD